MSDTGSRYLPPKTAAATQGRRGRLQRTVIDERLDALLVIAPVDIRYATGFIGDDSLVVAGRERSWIVSDARYDEYLNPWRAVDGIEVVMGTRHRLEATVRGLCDEHGIGRLGIPAERTTVAMRGRLAEAIGAERIVDTLGIMTRLRMRKDPDEIAAIERAIRFQQDGLSRALEHLRPGMSELEFAARLEYEMKSGGALGSSFAPIVASGANSSVIHYTTGTTPIESGVLLVDWGAMAGAYCSDMTRTFGVGSMPETLRPIYDVVLEAQLAAIDACAPGRTCAEIDEVARAIIRKAGYGDYFGHGLGHGLGLEVHEAPYFNDLETETRLVPGMVMTVEPGVYLPAVGGVRIEDDVLITETGSRVLGNFPKDADSAIIAPAGAVPVGQGSHST